MEIEHIHNKENDESSSDDDIKKENVEYLTFQLTKNDSIFKQLEKYQNT